MSLKDIKVLLCITVCLFDFDFHLLNKFSILELFYILWHRPIHRIYWYFLKQKSPFLLLIFVVGEFKQSLNHK